MAFVIDIVHCEVSSPPPSLLSAHLTTLVTHFSSDTVPLFSTLMTPPSLGSTLSNYTQFNDFSNHPI